MSLPAAGEPAEQELRWLVPKAYRWGRVQPAPSQIAIAPTSQPVRFAGCQKCRGGTKDKQEAPDG